MKKQLKLSALLMFISFAVSAAVPTDANDVKPLLPGMKIPNISAQNPTGETTNLTADTLSKPFVLTFYRGGWCPYCNTHLAELRHTEKKLIDMGFDVFFVSPDKPSALIESLKDQDLKKTIEYKLLSDASMKISRDFGIAFKVDDATVEKYIKWGLDLEKASGYDHHQLPAPSTYLVGSDGVIQFQYTNPNYSVRLDSDILMAAAESYISNKKKKAKK